MVSNNSSIPPLGLGTWTLTGERCKTAVLTALKVGYRHIDTAAYYRNEKEVGEAIRESGIPREKIFVTTKLAVGDQHDVEGALKTSLKNLGLESVDLYLMHFPVPERLAAWDEMTRLKKQGLAKLIGVSNFTIRHLKELMNHSKEIPVVNQVEFSPFLFQKELLEFCQNNKIALEAYSPLTRGQRLDDKTLNDIAKAHGKTPAQILIRWTLQHNVIVIPKASSERHIRENFDVEFDLTEEEMKKIDALNEDFRVCWDPSNAP